MNRKEGRRKTFIGGRECRKSREQRPERKNRSADKKRKGNMLFLYSTFNFDEITKSVMLLLLLFFLKKKLHVGTFG